jgi:hypothetical protein
MIRFQKYKNSRIYIVYFLSLLMGSDSVDIEDGFRIYQVKVCATPHIYRGMDWAAELEANKKINADMDTIRRNVAGGADGYKFKGELLDCIGLTLETSIREEAERFYLLCHDTISERYFTAGRAHIAMVEVLARQGSDDL